MVKSLYKNNEKGFTLLELMIVLFVASIIFLISANYLVKNNRELEKRMFLTSLQHDLLFTQAYAITHEKTTFLLNDLLGHKYYIYHTPTIILKEIDYSKEILLRTTTQTNPIKYLPNGNISRGGSLSLKLYGKNYEIIMYLGQGRFYVQE